MSLRSRFYALFFFWICPFYLHALTIIATLPVFAQIAHDIGREYVTVLTLSPYPSDPHYFNITPNQIHQIMDADYIIGPVEIIQRLPVPSEKKIDLALAWDCPVLQKSQPIQNLISILLDGDLSALESSYNPLKEITHEWMSFDSLSTIATILKNIYISKDPMNEAMYLKNHMNFQSELNILRSKYLGKTLPKPSLFYHNDFWIIEEELHTSFGKTLYSCDDSGMSPQTRSILATQSQNYNAFILDSSIPISSIQRLLSLVQCPVRTIESLGSLDMTEPTWIWLDRQLNIIYSPH